MGKQSYSEKKHNRAHVFTVKSEFVAAATITFERFQGPILLSKLKKVTKGAATI